MRVAVDLGRTAVSRPSGVSNPRMRFEGLGQVQVRLVDGFLQLGDLSDLLEGKDFIFLVTVDGQTGGIITTVLQPQQT